MKLISAYIFKKAAFNTFITLLILISFFLFFNIIETAGDIGKGQFDVLSLLIFVIATIPNYIYLFIPLAVLIGVMLTMLSLVNYSEYAIMRTSGVSLKKIAKILFCFGFMFSIITFFIGEILAPEANHFAQIYKKNKTKEIISNQLNSGIWNKDGENSFVNIKQVMPDNTLLGVNIFSYNSDSKLQYSLNADIGQFDYKKNIWNLENVTIKDFTGQNIKIQKIPLYNWKTSIEPSYFSVLIITPEEMSAFSLIQYIHHMEINNQSTQRYQVALWNKLLYPIACISMALIALAFIPNNKRNINLGSKLFIGIIIGVSYFFTLKLIGFMALLFNWNAIFASVSPTLILFTIGWYFVFRND